MSSFVELCGSQRIFSVGPLKDSALVMLDFEDHWGLEIRNVAGGGARSLPTCSAGGALTPAGAEPAGL